MTIAQMRYPCACKREFLQIKSCDRNKKNLLIQLGEHYRKLLTSCSLISQCSIGLVFGSSAANVRILKAVLAESRYPNNVLQQKGSKVTEKLPEIKIRFLFSAFYNHSFNEIQLKSRAKKRRWCANIDIIAYYASKSQGRYVFTCKKICDFANSSTTLLNSTLLQDTFLLLQSAQ